MLPVPALIIHEATNIQEVYRQVNKTVLWSHLVLFLPINEWKERWISFTETLGCSEVWARNLIIFSTTLTAKGPQHMIPLSWYPEQNQKYFQECTLMALSWFSRLLSLQMTQKWKHNRNGWSEKKTELYISLCFYPTFSCMVLPYPILYSQVRLRGRQAENLWLVKVTKGGSEWIVFVPSAAVLSRTVPLIPWA